MPILLNTATGSEVGHASWRRRHSPSLTCGVSVAYDVGYQGTGAPSVDSVTEVEFVGTARRPR